jgi:transposase InsO family protein
MLNQCVLTGNLGDDPVTHYTSEGLAIYGEIFYTLKEAKILIEKWRMEYNTFRPHSSLNYRPPAPEAYLN